MKIIIGIVTTGRRETYGVEGMEKTKSIKAGSRPKNDEVFNKIKEN